MMSSFKEYLLSEFKFYQGYLNGSRVFQKKLKLYLSYNFNFINQYNMDNT